MWSSCSSAGWIMSSMGEGGSTVDKVGAFDKVDAVESVSGRDIEGQA
jgi:hypothetical protein